MLTTAAYSAHCHDDDLDLDSTRKESGVYSGESDALSSCCSHSTCTEGDGAEEEVDVGGDLTPTASHVDLVWHDACNSSRRTSTHVTGTTTRAAGTIRSRSHGDRYTSTFGRYCGIYERELDKTLEADQWEERADHVFNMAEVGLSRHFVWQRSDDSFSVLDIVTPTSNGSRYVVNRSAVLSQGQNQSQGQGQGHVVNVRANRYYDLDSSSSSTPVSSVSSSPNLSDDDVSVNRWSACWNDEEFTLVLQQRCYMPETRC